MTDLTTMVKEMHWTTQDIVRITGTSLRSAQRFVKQGWAPEAEMRLLGAEYESVIRSATVY